ncbi:AAA family ATPase [Blautia stercoris]
MPLTRIEAENFTVFEDITIPFSKGLNVLVGENGMGKNAYHEAGLCSVSGIKT